TRITTRRYCSSISPDISPDGDAGVPGGAKRNPAFGYCVLRVGFRLTPHPTCAYLALNGS
ncbi:MAG: hypothetical protein E7I42_27855, partial [Pluralibacter gergoviae]|nr:hypothetical protein [Pluralibacter gergoviae]